MREYKIRFSYLLNGERVYEYEYFGIRRKA